MLLVCHDHERRAIGGKLAPHFVDCRELPGVFARGQTLQQHLDQDRRGSAAGLHLTDAHGLRLHYQHQRLHWRGGGRSFDVLEVENRNRLRFAVLQQSEIFLLQPGERLTLLVAREHCHEHEIG